MHSAAVDLLSRYAAYHRDERNITSHCIGVPMIVFALGVLLARPEFAVRGLPLPLTPGWLVFAPVALWYLSRGNVTLGLAASAAVGALMLLAQQLSGGSVAVWLSWGLGLFAFGWLIQFAGHLYEGRKPAFTADLASLAVAPMFIAAEALFALGWNKPMLAEIERRVGPTRLRDLAAIRA